MADERMAPAAVAQQSPIHHSTVFGKAGYDSTTTCGRVEQPKPSASDWALVSCPACLAVAPVEERKAIAMRLAKLATETHGSLAPLGDLLLAWGAES